MKFRILFIAIIASISLFSQTYYQQSRYWGSSPGSFKNGLYGFDNPALLAYQHQPDIYFTWSNENIRPVDFTHWGLFVAVPHFGFAVSNEKARNFGVTDYKLSTGFGSDMFSFGMGYGWSKGDVFFFDRKDHLTIGAIARPSPYISLGAITNLLFSADNSEVILDAAVRPMGNEFLSLFADYLFKNNFLNQENRWSAGVALEPYPGLRVTGRYFENQFFTVGAEVSFGRFGVSSITNLDKDGKYSFNTYGIRIGAYDRNIFQKSNEKTKYVELNLLGGLNYRKFILFDNSKTFYSLLDQIKAAQEDNSVSGIAINISGMEINRELLWELREQLKRFKQSGKKVFIYLDRVGIDEYHFASIADKIIMDPLGMITLQGYLSGRTYLAGMLEKIGIGFHEWRYFKYKSAVENLSRTNMSEGDSIQRKDFIDDFYTLAQTDICASRNFTTDEFDNIVDNTPLSSSNEAIRLRLVDTLARWDAVKEMINKIEGDEKSFVNAGSLSKYQLPEDNYWGEKPEIAIIYGLGACAMDEGINARKLVNIVRSAGDNENVKGIIFRVDSPGGDALASDLVAEALKYCKEKKPVIISQGSVAASGGYWLSMYGDQIIAAPNTLTGSIGVIGGWAYNKELKENIGVTTDYVKRGKHADFGFGMTVPFIGLSLPDRDLNPEEQKIIDHVILQSYDEFVLKVAAGRNKSKEYIYEIAQGRVWSGYDGLNNGLVDKLGGLEDAIEMVLEKAGLTGKEYQIKEYPDQSLINFNAFMPNIPFINIEENVFINHLKFRLNNIGKPLPILPLSEMDFVPVY